MQSRDEHNRMSLSEGKMTKGNATTHLARTLPVDLIELKTEAPSFGRHQVVHPADVTNDAGILVLCQPFAERWLPRFARGDPLLASREMRAAR